MKDQTINDVFNLDFGEQARREYVGGKWTRGKMEDKEDGKSFAIAFF
jgi:hypothetical protein